MSLAFADKFGFCALETKQSEVGEKQFVICFEGLQAYSSIQ